MNEQQRKYIVDEFYNPSHMFSSLIVRILDTGLRTHSHQYDLILVNCSHENYIFKYHTLRSQMNMNFDGHYQLQALNVALWVVNKMRGNLNLILEIHM